MSTVLNDEYQRLVWSSIAHWCEMAKASIDYAAAHYQQPSVLYRPRIYLDGNKWCALYGDNLQDGVCGFGASPQEAMLDFDAAWVTKIGGTT